MRSSCHNRAGVGRVIPKWLAYFAKSVADDRIGAGQAADELGLSTQGVRDLIRAQKLDATKGPNGRWSINATSVEGYLEEHGRKRGRTQSDVDSMRERLAELGQSIAVLMEDRRSSDRLFQALERERDRYRADAVASRAAAAAILASTKDTYSAVEGLLDALRKQENALTQFLTPGSLQEVL